MREGHGFSVSRKLELSLVGLYLVNNLAVSRMINDSVHNQVGVCLVSLDIAFVENSVEEELKAPCTCKVQVYLAKGNRNARVLPRFGFQPKVSSPISVQG